MKKEISQKAFQSLVVQLVPLLLGLLLIPILIKGMGGERFSFLSLGWAILGYFSFFDLGVGRTLTKVVAEDLDIFGRPDGLKMVSGSFVFVAAMSVLAAGGSFLGVDWFVIKYLNVPEELRNELVISARILVLGIPLVTLAAAFRGVIEGLNDFKTANRIQFLNGVVVFVFPFIGWQIESSMISVSLLLIFGRLLVFVVSGYFLLNRVVGLKSIQWRLNLSEIMSVLRHGGWITFGNALAPLMVNLDKVLIGGLVKLSQLAIYTTPMEVVSRIWIFPAAITRILFPKLAEFNRFPDRLVDIFDHGNSIILIFIFPTCLILSAFSAEWIHLWLGDSFGLEGALVTKVLVFGVFLNSLNWISYSWLLASKYVRWSVYTVLIEIPLFFLALYLFTKNFGILGAAMAWSLRMVFDFILTVTVIARLESGMIRPMQSACLWGFLGGPLIFLVSIIPDLGVRFGAVVILLMIFLYVKFSVITELLPRRRL